MRLSVPAALAAALVPAAALADACETVKAAYDRFAAAPAYRQSVSLEGTGTVELVMIGDAMHMQDGSGEWTTLSLEPGMRAQMMEATIPDASALADCRELGAETLDGRETTVFEYVPPAMEGVDQGPQKVWVDADGLPRRMTAVQEGSAVDVRIAYEDVSAPNQ